MVKDRKQLRSLGVEDTLVDAGYSVMISDVRMPGMSGIALAEEAVRRRPDLRVILISGFIAIRYVCIGLSRKSRSLAPSCVTLPTAPLDAMSATAAAHRAGGSDARTAR
jgi:DNA-binding NtrC family response regulator